MRSLAKTVAEGRAQCNGVAELLFTAPKKTKDIAGGEGVVPGSLTIDYYNLPLGTPPGRRTQAYKWDQLGTWDHHD